MPSSIYTDILTDKRLTIFTDTNTGLKTYTDTFTDTYICMILIYQYLPIFRKGENIQNASLAAPGALANRLQRHTACNATPPATPHCLQHLTARLIQNGTWVLEIG